MLTHRNLLMACFAALLALGLAACGTGGNGPGPTTDDEDDQAMMPVTPEPDPEPEPDERADAQKAAQDAADAADGFATTAGTDAMAAVAAAMGRARFQTIAPSSYKHAHDATTHAGYARTAADDAQTAADEAAAATTVTAAVLAQGRAQDARDSAETHRGHVTGHVTSFYEMAVAAAAMEVFVGEDNDGNATYTIGGTTINAGAPARTVDDDGQVTTTGLMAGMNPMHAVAMIPGVEAVAADPDADPAVAGVAPTATVAPMTVTIGKTIDSSDDTARLMLVTHYAGSKTVNVYSVDAGAGDDEMTTRERKISIGVGDDGDANTDDDTYADLKSEGMYYPVGTDGIDTNGDLEEADMLASGTDPVEVFSYTDENEDTVYVVLFSKLEQGDTTTYTYRPVDATITVGLGADAVAMSVTASLADETAYKHINFGVWAALGEAAKSGMQDITDLGVGFVDSIGDGMTGEDMPNNGEARYEGDWVATVRAADRDGDGDISLEHGAATLMADFGDGDITATLTGLATLEGDITGNAFSGTEATVEADNTVGLTAGDDNFTGTFNGAFFGSKAAEAGGVFNFTSEDKEDGEFAGAFGGDRQ